MNNKVKYGVEYREHSFRDPKTIKGSSEFLKELDEYIKLHPERYDEETGMFDFGPVKNKYMTVYTDNKSYLGIIK